MPVNSAAAEAQNRRPPSAALNLPRRVKSFEEVSPLKVENLTQMNIRSEIVTQFTQVAQDHAQRLAPLTDDLELLNSGLDSLCFAVVVIRLQDVLGVDPFST